MRKPRSSAQCLAITMLALIGLISGNTLPVAVQSTTVSAQPASDDLLTQSSTPGANGKIAFASTESIYDIYVMNADGSSQINLTNNQGLNDTPTWSPDGTRIAFSSGRDGNREIYVMNADGSNATKLTNDPAFDGEPTWSPDGAKIAFTRQQVDFTSYNAEIYVMNADGSNQSRLTNSRPFGSFGYSREPTWSPKDGNRIAFTSDRFGSGQQIYVMNADGSNQTRLPTSQAYDSQPDWSPDGTRIAFARGDSIYVMNADGSNLTKLTNSGFDSGPDWSADGARITFERASDSDSSYAIYVMNADGSSQTRLTDFAGYQPTWSPDGDRIAFTTFRIIDYEIFAVNADGSNQTNLTNNPASDSDPDWSPDGTRIAFTTIRGGNPAIYVMNADGSNQRRLTNFPADVTSSGPAWSPDGTRIAFASTRNSIRQSIYVMNADGSNQTRLTNELAYDQEPVWSPDGARIAFTREAIGIYVINADGSNQTRLTNSESDSPDWSPDGTRIVYQCFNDICVMNADGSKQVNLTNSPAVEDGGPAWSPDGARIALTRNGLGGNEIYVMNPDGSNQTRLVNNRGTYYPRGLAWQALPATNLIDDARIFVRQHYLDFLNREPDQAGWDYWTNEITRCGTDSRCIHSRRIGVSAAFFIESEFQDTGYYVYRFYKASFGRQPNFAEFMSDRSQVVAGANLEAGKQAFADQWVQRPAFLQAFSNTMSNTEYVNKLFDTAGLTASRFDVQRQQEIAAMNAGRSRAFVLRDVIEIPDFKNVPNPQDPRYVEIKLTSQYNPAFVLMQYFGYLRRNIDQSGYDFWLDVVNNREPNNYRGMVCAFITSREYQLRFGADVTRSNADCGQ